MINYEIYISNKSTGSLKSGTSVLIKKKSSNMSLMIFSSKPNREYTICYYKSSWNLNLFRKLGKNESITIIPKGKLEFNRDEFNNLLIKYNNRQYIITKSDIIPYKFGNGIKNLDKITFK